MIWIALIIGQIMPMFIQGEYEMFKGKTDQELQQFLGLHEEFYRDTLLTMF